ncbi:MAG: alkaline phosphatase family protein [Chromatiales bacterium]|nr:alkaline phosphatase family protein [Chromatiales bacterium]
MSSLGHPCIRTPHLDALCRDGVTFRNHYSQGAPCGPARASLLTGQYMMTHRVVQNGIPMDARHNNLAYELRRLRYKPAMVGYTTTTPDPREVDANDPRFGALGDLMPGWDPIARFEPARRPYFDWLRQHDVELPAKPDDIWLPADESPTAPSGIPACYSDTSYATEHGLAYLRGMQGRPWALHLGYYRPHPPFIAPAPYNAAYDPEEVPAPARAANATQEGAQHPMLEHYLGHITQRKFFENGVGLGCEMDEDAVRAMRSAYYGLIAEVDEHLGRVIGYLKESGQYDDTLIVFTSDHGEQLGDHHLLGKLGYFDESYHVPMVVRDPRATADGARGAIVDSFTEAVDVMPTILDWLGVTKPRECAGASLMPFIRGETPTDWRHEVHWEYDFRPYYADAGTPPPYGLSIDECSLSVIRDEKYKYVHFDALPALFFDLEADPHQFVNRATDPAFGGCVLEYAQKMLSWRMRNAERTLTGYSSSPTGLLKLI